MLTVDEIQRRGEKFLIHRFHALARERAGVLDLPVRVGVNDATRPEAFTELGILGIVRVLWLFFGVQVVEVAEELVEAMIGGEELVFIA